MRVVPHPAAASAPAAYAAADEAFAEAKAYLSSREARQMSESDLERELDRRGRELMQKLLQGHLDQRSPGEAAGPVAGSDGVECRERRVHKRAVETVFGTVKVGRVGYARPGHDSLHPLDASLNLPPERYSLEVRRRVAAAAASRSFDEALLDLSDSTGAVVPKRQAEQLAARAAEDFDAFYEARRAAAGEPAPEESVVVLTFDGKGVVLHREDLREATRKEAERRRRQREQLSPFNRLKPGEKKHSKRMATVAAVYSVAPYVRSPDEFLQSLMPRQPGDKTKKGKKAPAVRPRPVAKRVWASLEREPGEVIVEAMLEAERHDPERVSAGWCSSTGPRRSSTSWKRAPPNPGWRSGGPGHHPRGRTCGRRRAYSIPRGAPSCRTGRGRGCGAFSKGRPAGWRRRCGVRRLSPACRRTPASRSIRAPTTC